MICLISCSDGITTNNEMLKHTSHSTGVQILASNMNSLAQSTTSNDANSSQITHCTKGVDCYCDKHKSLVFCEDFADGTFGKIKGGCSNNGGPWPNCRYLLHKSVSSGGYRDDLNDISDDGAILTSMNTRSTGQMASFLAMSLSSPLQDGEGSFGVLMKAGKTFWEAFATGSKFIAFRPKSPDPRQIVFLRPADNNGINGCFPGTYGVLNASGGGGAAISFDEFGNSNPWDSKCYHTIKFGNNLANQWVYIEWEIHSVSSKLDNVVHVFLQDGTVMRSKAPVTSNTIQYSVELFHWQEEPTPSQATVDDQSFVYIDLLRVNRSYMGPPQGFLTKR